VIVTHDPDLAARTDRTLHLVDGVSREITWPAIELVAGHGARDVVIVVGPEPSLRWRAVLGEIVDAAVRLGVTRAFTVGGIPSVASHRRPIEVLVTGTSADIVNEAGAWRTDYTGPTGAQSALQVLLGQAGVPAIVDVHGVEIFGPPQEPAANAIFVDVDSILDRIPVAL
jgi:hypothetical protein